MVVDVDGYLVSLGFVSFLLFFFVLIKIKQKIQVGQKAFEY